MHDRALQLVDVLAAKRSRIEERFPQRHAEAELIRARIDATAAERLGGHVCGRAEHGARGREREVERIAGVERCLGIRRRRHVAGQAHEPEVEHLHDAARVEHDVGGLEVAMHEALRVCSGQRFAGGEVLVDDLAPVRAFPARERGAVDELHRDEQRAVVDADVVDLDDVRVGEASQRLRLAERPLARFVGAVGQRPAYHLDGDVAVELRIAGAKDLAHAACAEPGDDPVAPHRLGRRVRCPRQATGVRRVRDDRLRLLAVVIHRNADRCIAIACAVVHRDKRGRERARIAIVIVGVGRDGVP